MFDSFSGGESDAVGARSRLLKALVGAGAVYVALGLAGAALLAHFAPPLVEEEKAVDVKFVASSPPPPPPPPPVATAAPPKPAALAPPKSRAPKPDEVLPPVKPIEAPDEVPVEAPKEADPGQETGPPPSPDGPGEGDPFGQRGGHKDGVAHGTPGGEGSAPPGPAAPVILPAGATAPEPVDASAKPEYPRAAIEARFEGEVVVKVIVQADGRVELVKVIKSDPNFDGAVLDFLKNYRMKPAMYNGKPIAVFRNLRFPFKLN